MRASAINANLLSFVHSATKLLKRGFAIVATRLSNESMLVVLLSCFKTVTLAQMVHICEEHRAMPGTQ